MILATAYVLSLPECPLARAHERNPTHPSPHRQPPTSTRPTAKRSPSGGDACPCSFAPQQTGLPSGRSAHVYSQPLLIAANRSPPSGDAPPNTSDPQQSALPSGRNAHVWKAPLLIDVNPSPSRRCRLSISIMAPANGDTARSQPAYMASYFIANAGTQ